MATPRRHQVVVLVEQLEAGTGGPARMARSHRERGDQVTERFDDPDHQRDSRFGQHLQLAVRFLGVSEEPLEDL